MDRRELLIGSAVVALLAACRGGGGGSDPFRTPASSGASSGDGEARSSALRRPGDASPQIAVEAVNGLGTDLFRSMAAGRPEANLVLSPASIAIALAMTREGAVGTTARQMDQVLGVVDPATLAPSMNSLDHALAARSGRRPDPAGTGAVDVTLRMANGLWGQQGLAWEQACLDRLAVHYGAGLELADFAGDPDAARRDINTWVAGQTEDRIRELLPEGLVDQLTRMVLVNAIYLKAPWIEPFPEGGTRDGAFTRAGGSKVPVPMMSSSGQRAYAAADGWQSVDLPYAGYELTMTVLVPDAGRLADVEAQVSPELLDAIVATQGLRQVTLRLPRWDVGSVFPLADALAALGMPAAFDPGSADFSALTATEQLYLSAVQHQADITVDEAGTEAAAATAVVGRATSAPIGDPVELVVDRPFLFFIRDLPTGSLLFLGRITDPSQTRL